MAALKRLVLGLLTTAILLAGVGFALPDTARLQRAAMIAASPSEVYARISDLRELSDWAPWTDPDTRYHYSDPGAGIGALMLWSGNGSLEVASGSWQIVAAEPPHYLKSELYLDGRGPAYATFLLKPVGQGTFVTWRLERHYGYDLLGRFAGLFLERRQGPRYERGLASLQALTEEDPSQPATATATSAEAPPYEGVEIHRVEVPATQYIYIRGTTTQRPEDIRLALREAHDRIARLIAESDLERAGQPMAIAHDWDEGTYSYEAAIPVSNGDIARVKAEVAALELSAPSAGAQRPPNSLRVGSRGAGQAVRAVHRGPYEEIQRTYAAIHAYLAEHDLERAGRAWEVYVSDPEAKPKSERVTLVYYPVRGG